MKPWEILLRPVEIRIRPQPGRELTSSVEVDYEYDEYMSIQHKTIQVNRDLVETRCEYPDEFKKLVAACESPDEAFEIYKKLQEPVPVNWDDFL